MRGLKRILLKAGAKLDVSVAVEGKPKPEVKWEASGRDLDGEYKEIKIKLKYRYAAIVWKVWKMLNYFK